MVVKKHQLEQIPMPPHDVRRNRVGCITHVCFIDGNTQPIMLMNKWANSIGGINVCPIHCVAFNGNWNDEARN